VKVFLSLCIGFAFGCLFMHEPKTNERRFVRSITSPGRAAFVHGDGWAVWTTNSLGSIITNHSNGWMIVLSLKEAQ
jgi:hypothetical protein